MRSIQIQIRIRAADVGIPEGERLIRLKPERALRVLANAVEIRRVQGEKRRELEILILEDEVCGGLTADWGGVEEGAARGAAADGEAEGGGVLEREDEV